MSIKNKSRKARTWTFQPAQDVAKMVHEYFGKAISKGDKTRLFNEAMRHQLPSAALAVAEQELAAKQSQVEQLKKKTERDQSLQSEQKPPKKEPTPEAAHRKAAAAEALDVERQFRRRQKARRPSSIPAPAPQVK